MALATTNDPLFDNFSHLKTFPDHILRDIARNDCAEHAYRKHAVEILVVRKSPLAAHPDLQALVRELNIELEGIQFEYPDPGPGPLVASVTTETVNKVEEVVISPAEKEIPEIPTETEPVPEEAQTPSVPKPEVVQQAKPKITPRKTPAKETPPDATQ